MIDLRSIEFQFVGVSSSADDATAAKMPSPVLAAVAFGSALHWSEWFARILHPYDFPPKWTVCTVTAAKVDDEGSWIKIAEHYSYDENYWSEWFAADRFVPIVERKTDISALEALLVPGAKIRETA